MYGSNLRLEGRVHKTVPCKSGLFVKERGDNSCFEGLAASAYTGERENVNLVVGIYSGLFVVE